MQSHLLIKHRVSYTILHNAVVDSVKAAAALTTLVEHLPEDLLSHLPARSSGQLYATLTLSYAECRHMATAGKMLSKLWHELHSNETEIAMLPRTAAAGTAAGNCCHLICELLSVVRSWVSTRRICCLGILLWHKPWFELWCRFLNHCTHTPHATVRETVAHAVAHAAAHAVAQDVNCLVRLFSRRLMPSFEAIDPGSELAARGRKVTIAST